MLLLAMRAAETGLLTKAVMRIPDMRKTILKIIQRTVTQRTTMRKTIE